MSLAMATAVLFVLLSIWAVTNVESASHHAAPAPAVDCSTVILNMADCLSYVTVGSTIKKPEGSCCSGLKKVLKADAECLCEAFQNSAQLGVSLNVTKALALPAACHLSAPSVSNCGMSIGTGAAPAESPMAMTPRSEAAFAPNGGIAPVPVPGKSDSSALVASAVTLILGLLFSVYFSSY